MALSDAPKNVVEYLTEGNSIEDLAGLYWDLLTEKQRKELLAEIYDQEC